MTKCKIIAGLLTIMIFTTSFPKQALALELSLPQCLQLGNYRWVTEAERRKDTKSIVEARKNRINSFNQRVEKKYKELITQKADALIKPDTHSGIKFGVGVLEGIPLGFKDLGLFVYSLAEHLRPINLYGTTMNSYYQVKDNPDPYIFLLKHPVTTGKVFGGALYQVAKQYTKEISSDYRKAGNLTGELLSPVVLLGGVKLTGKVLSTVSKVGSSSKLTLIPPVTSCVKVSKKADESGSLFFKRIKGKYYYRHTVFSKKLELADGKFFWTVSSDKMLRISKNPQEPLLTSPDIGKYAVGEFSATSGVIMNWQIYDLGGLDLKNVLGGFKSAKPKFTPLNIDNLVNRELFALKSNPKVLAAEPPGSHYVYYDLVRTNGHFSFQEKPIVGTYGFYKDLGKWQLRKGTVKEIEKQFPSLKNKISLQIDFGPDGKIMNVLNLEAVEPKGEVRKLLKTYEIYQRVVTKP